MYLEIFQYNSTIYSEVEYVQQEIRDFINENPQFEVIKTESLVTESLGRVKQLINIHVWYVERGGC